MKRIMLAALLVLAVTGGAKAQLGFLDKPKDFDTQMKALTKQLTKSLSEGGKKQIAIMEFPDVNGKVTELGKLIPEELTTRMFKATEFQVVERQLLNKVLEEQKLGASGVLDPNSVAEIGNVLGVDAIVTGTVVDRGDAIRINARMIETEQAHVFAVASVSVSREAYLLNLLGKEADNFVSDNAPSHSSENEKETEVYKKAVVGDLKVELVAAERDNTGMLHAECVVTNKGKYDVEVIFYRWEGTQCFDNLGQEYGCEKIMVGNKKNAYHGLEHRLISDVPTKIEFYFPKMDQAAKSVALMKLALKIGDNRDLVEFRKVAIQ